jgi:hypothetical protein
LHTYATLTDKNAYGSVIIAEGDIVMEAMFLFMALASISTAHLLIRKFLLPKMSNIRAGLYFSVLAYFLYGLAFVLFTLTVSNQS